MTSRRLAIFMAGAALLGCFWLVTRSGPERQIQRQTEAIREWTSKAPGESDLEGLGRAKKISALLAETFEVDAPQYGFSTRDRRAVAGLVHRYRSRSSVIAARVLDHEIGLDPTNEHATSHLTAQFLTGPEDLAGTETYRFQINWRLEAGDWKPDYVRLIDVVDQS